MGCYALLIFSGCCRKDRGKVRFLKWLWIMSSNSPAALYGSSWHLLPLISHFGGFTSVNTMWIGIMMMTRIISDLCWALKGMIISLNIIIQFQFIPFFPTCQPKRTPYPHQERLCWSGNVPMALLFFFPQCTCSDPLVQLNLTNASGQNCCQQKRPISCKCSWEFTLLPTH